MDRALHSRRRVLHIGGVALAVGLAGCSDTSRSDEAPADQEANDTAGGGGMDGGNESDGVDGGNDSGGTNGGNEDGPIGDSEAGGGELDEPPDNVEGDEGLGRGEDEGEELGQGAANATVTVAPGGTLEFDPPSVEVQQGEMVRWEWDSADHTVTPDATPEDADWEGAPQSHNNNYVYEYTFETAGTYTYYCDNHPEEMTGRVVVHG